jgi:predicted nucleotidyltransferase
MHDKPLVEYALKLAKVTRREVRFVILDGSTAEGKDNRFSDYDIVVVKQEKLKRPGSFEDLFGVFRGRIVSGWLVDEESFESRYIGMDDEQFLWRKKQLSKARLLYGNVEEFSVIIRVALARRWNRTRQFAVIKDSYVTMLEYLGKMLSKMNERDTPEFYQDGYVITKNAALLVAALNKIDLDSDKNMYQHILAWAKNRPPGFLRDFRTASGLASSRRDRKGVVSASRRLVRWARNQIITSFEPVNTDGPGFWQLVREVRF